MKQTSSKDLMLIFLLASIIAIFTSTRPFNIINLDVLLFILIIGLSGYSLMAFLYPEESSAGILRKPLIITTLSIFLAILISLILKISPLGLHFRDLTWFLSLITALISITAYIIRIKNRRAKIQGKEKTTEKAIPIRDEKYRNKNLIMLTLLSLIMLITLLIPPLNKTPIWMFPGSLFVCLIPGYLLFEVTFPKNDDLELIERLSLSFGSSLILTSIIGLIFNYTSWGIRLELIIIVLAVFSLFLCLITYLRTKKIPSSKRISIPKLEKMLSIFLILCIILVIGTAAYSLIKIDDLNPGNTTKNATTFYVENLNFNTSGYTLDLISGEQRTLNMILVNQEGSTVNYSIVVQVNNSILQQENITLGNNQKMEIPLNFTAGIPGERNMEFILYKLPDQNPYQKKILKMKIT